ncbi:MAG: hypothetical protein ACWGQW_00695 [bacterium]
MAIEIQGRYDTSVNGITRSTIEGSAYSWAHLGWAEQIIHVSYNDGSESTYIAGQIAANILNTDVRDVRCTYPSVKFGPGGRRIYVQVTEKLVDDILRHVDTRNDWYRSDRERNRGVEIEDFATLLIDFITAAPGQQL